MMPKFKDNDLISQKHNFKKTLTTMAGVPLLIAQRIVSRVPEPPPNATQTTGTLAASADNNINIHPEMSDNVNNQNRV